MKRHGNRIQSQTYDHSSCFRVYRLSCLLYCLHHSIDLVHSLALQDNGGLDLIHNAHVVRTDRTTHLSQLFTWVTAECTRLGKPEVARLICAIIKRMLKAIDTDNKRKMRTSTELLFVSWANRLMNDEHPKCELHKLLKDEPWRLDEEDIGPFFSGMKRLLRYLVQVGQKGDAKVFRDQMHKELLALSKSPKTKIVRNQPLIFSLLVSVQE